MSPKNIEVAHGAKFNPPESKTFVEYSHKSSLEPQEVPLCSLPADVPTWLRYELAALDATCSEQRELAYIARKESTFRAGVKNAVSSAGGLYQFLDSTWNYLGCEGSKYNSIDASTCALNVIRQQGSYDTWRRWW